MNYLKSKMRAEHIVLCQLPYFPNLRIHPLFFFQTRVQSSVSEPQPYPSGAPSVRTPAVPGVRVRVRGPEAVQHAEYSPTEHARQPGSLRQQFA